MKRLTVWVDCDDDSAEIMASRIGAYLSSLGALNVNTVSVEAIQPSGSKK
jgi:hypothetical protein